MRKFNVAFDVDGTLRANREEIHRTKVVENPRIVDMLHTMASLKNVTVHVWSNRGADYCWEIVQAFDLPVKRKNCHQKTWEHNREDGDGFIPHICFDDQQRFDGGIYNLIVREK